MINFESLLSFVTLSFLLAVSPGPSNAFLMAQTFAKGKTAGMQTAFGFATAGVVHTILAVAGLSVILKTSEIAYQTLLSVGALYLVYLGVTSIIDSLRPPEEIHCELSGKKEKNIFVQAMLTEIFNPKVALFFLAFIPQFADSTLATPVWLQLLIFGLLYPILAFPIDVMYVKSGNKIAGYFKHHPSAQQWIDRIAGGIFILLGLRLILEVF